MKEKHEKNSTRENVKIFRKKKLKGGENVALISDNFRQKVKS
jgi:hypothetical protein